jgi:hypothetical protein
MPPKEVQYKCFATKRCFGVELETSPNISRQEIKRLIASVSPERQIQVSDWAQSIDNTYWHIKHDSTCGEQGHLKPDYGWEVASYKAKGHLDISHIAKVADFLREKGLKVNDNCGLHIHVELKDFDVKQTAILMAYWYKIEHVICCMVPSRRVNNKHCRLWTKSRKLSIQGQYSPEEMWGLLKPTNYQDHGNSQKRMTLNLVNYAATIAEYKNRKTIELRLPEGTLVGEDIANWIKMFVHFVMINKKKEMPANLLPVKSLDEFFEIVGLYDPNVFYLLSTGLRKTKMWILKRILESDWAGAKQKKLQEEARDKLQMLMEPPPELDVVFGDAEKSEELPEFLKKYHSHNDKYKDEEFDSEERGLETDVV